MDFDKLLAKAGSNLKKHSKKVQEADLEMEIDRQRKLERLAMQKKMNKEEIRRKAPAKPEPPKERSFVIPKKAQKSQPEVDKEKLAKFLNRQEQEKRQKEIKKQKEKDELIRLRLESMGGKANKKLSKQFGKSPIELQIRYGKNSEHADILMKQQQREEEEHDKLTALYRQGVCKAVQHKNQTVAKLLTGSSAKKECGSSKIQSSSTSRPESSSRPTTAPNKRLPVPAASIKDSASSSKNRLNGVPSNRKRKAPEIEDFQLLMKKAQNNRHQIEEDGSSEDLPPHSKSMQNERSFVKKERQHPIIQEKVDINGPLPKQQDSFKKPFNPVPSKSFASKQNNFAPSQPSSSKSFKKPQLPCSSKLSRPQQPAINNSAEGDRGALISGTSKQHPVPTEKTKKVVVVDPETGVVKDKKYLPGDIRYKGGPSAPPPPGVQKKITPISRMQESAPKQRREENGFTKAVNTSSSMTNPGPSQRRSEIDPGRPPVSSANTKPSKLKTEEVMRAEIERRRREARLMEKELEQRRIQAEQRKMDISLSKIKRDEKMRLEMRQQQQQKSRKPVDYSREQVKKKIGNSSRFTNFSETDEDEEDEEHYEESDEYDSEMDDFIDDSIVDDLQREDFEESLKLINPRYDKKKWKMREMMIDDRKMDARYKDIETEEKLSAKIGLYEDIREARRGSKQVG